MEVTKKKLDNAAAEHIISTQQADALYAFLNAQSQDEPRFTLTHALYYLGGLIAISAMTLFMTLGWEAFGGAGIFFISLLYAGVGFKFCNSFATKGLVIPAGICATFVVCLTPLAIYGLQNGLGLWPDDTVYRDYHRYIKWHWLYMELGTMAVGAMVAWKYKYPFLIMPIAVTLWYMTMDLTVVLADGDYSWELRILVSMYTGLLMIGLAIWVDIRTYNKADYAFWIYLFGVIAFWSGLSAQNSDSELAKFSYFCINLIMIFVGVVLLRRVFVVFGAIGGFGYIGYLAYHVFEDSLLFPVAMTAIGFGIIYIGVLWQKHEKTITEKSRLILPDPLREMIDARS